MINKNSILALVSEVARRNVCICDRLYFKFNDNDVINTRYCLAYGVLSSGVKDEHAKYISKSITTILMDDVYHEDHFQKVAPLLSCEHGSSHKWRYRFPNVRADWLHLSLKALQHYDNKLPINRKWSYIEQRDALLDVFKGIGLKQASLMLRNLSYNFDCCVVDTHILDFLILMDVLPKEIKTYSMSRKRYIAIESMFKFIAIKLGLPVALLDIAVWDAVRIIKKWDFA